MATGWRTWLTGALAAGLCGTINHGCGSGDVEGNSKTSSCTGASCTPSVTGPMSPSGQSAGTAGANASPGSTGEANAPAQGTAGSTPSAAGSTAPPVMMVPPSTVTAGSTSMDPPTMMDPMNPVEMVPSMPSSGCGAAEHPESGTFMIDVDGTPREYIVKIPADYDMNKPYKLVYA